MQRSWKKIVIAGEATALLALTAAGVHFALQQHDTPVQPPPLFLPLHSPPPVLSPLASPAAGADALSRRKDPSRGLLAGFSREDRHMLDRQWQVLQQLIHAVVGYVEHRVVPDMFRAS